MKLHIKGSSDNEAKKITTFAHFSTTELVFKYFWRQVQVRALYVCGVFFSLVFITVPFFVF